MMYSAYKLNNQGDNIQPWRTPFPIWNQSAIPCPVLTVASWPAYRFLKRWVRWFGIPITLSIFHSLLWSTQGFGIANKAEIDVFLELSCFFDDPADVGNLTSGCSAFSKTSLNFYAEYIMWNARMDEAQAGIKILGEISITSDMKMTLPLWQKAKNNLRDSWWNWKRRVKTLAKNPTFRKLISCHWVPSLHGKRWGNNGNSETLYFWGVFKITADGDCSHEIERCLLLGRKAITNLDSILKSRDITLPTKVCLIKVMVFPGVIYRYEILTLSTE